MPGNVRVDWRGPFVSGRVRKASKAAIDDITQAAADDAGSDHWWRNRSGDLEANVISTPAVTMREGARGSFGIAKVSFYGYFLEIKQPFIRPAGDRHFPRLSHLIRFRL